MQCLVLGRDEGCSQLLYQPGSHPLWHPLILSPSFPGHRPQQFLGVMEAESFAAEYMPALGSRKPTRTASAAPSKILVALFRRLFRHLQNNSLNRLFVPAVPFHDGK